MTETERERYVLELTELMDTCGFSLETVSMALHLARRSEGEEVSLQEKIDDGTYEEQRDSLLALDALATAKEAFAKLSSRFSCSPLDGMGLDIQFWSVYEDALITILTPDVVEICALKLSKQIEVMRKKVEQLQLRLFELLPSATEH